MRMALMSASTVAPLKYDSSPTSPDTRGRTLIGFAQVLGRQSPPNRGARCERPDPWDVRRGLFKVAVMLIFDAP